MGVGGSRKRGWGNRALIGVSLSLHLVTLAGLTATAVVWTIAETSTSGSDSAGYVVATGVVVSLVATGVVAAQRWVGRSTSAHLRRMEHRASHDELTGLINRDELLDRLDQILHTAYRHDRSVAVLFLDLDGFKAINDSMGHETGDELLRAFGRRLEEHIRRGDLAARIGGDEFVVVAPDVGGDHGGREVAENIRLAMSDPVEIPGGSAVMIPSIGVAVASRGNPVDPEEIVAQADQAMYRAKRAGMGVDIFDDRSRRETLDRRAVERDLVPALAEGQFQVHYQPIVSDSEERVVSLEGLIRWRHPVHGVIGPDRFLAVAEEAGLVSRLGEVVLREVAAQTSVWNHLFATDHGPSVSVNLAERQLVEPAFPDRVDEIVEWAGIPHNQLDLEVGEELLLRRVDDSSGVLRRLSALGCRIVIDDFGIAQGAFSRIRDLDLVDVVKVDRTIIAGVVDDPVSRAVVEATVSMARALDIEVVAEGVETEIQRRVVTNLGVDLLQGFLFLRPSPAEVFDPEGVGAMARSPFTLR